MTATEDLLTVGLASRHAPQLDRHVGGPALAQLNPMRREFVFHYVMGEDGVRGVKYKAYLAAGYNAKDNNVASAAAYQLLQDPTVKDAVEELRKEIDKAAAGQMKSWVVLAKKAQILLEGYMDTLLGSPPATGAVLLSSNALAAIKEVLDRGIGKPVQPVENDIGPRLDSLIKELAGQRTRPSLREPSSQGHRDPEHTPGQPSSLLVEGRIVDSERERESLADGVRGGGMGRERVSVSGATPLAQERLDGEGTTKPPTPTRENEDGQLHSSIPINTDKKLSDMRE